MAEGKPRQAYLTFSFLDDVLGLPQGERRKKIDDSVPNRIGPLVEDVLFDHASGRSYHTWKQSGGESRHQGVTWHHTAITWGVKRVRGGESLRILRWWSRAASAAAGSF